MKVTKDNTYQIKEHIEVNFKSKSHGIYRDIPLVNDVKREDGSSNRIVARVENLDCGDEEYDLPEKVIICMFALVMKT